MKYALLTLLLLFGMVSTAQATTYYISPTGVDTVAGGGGTTTSNPWGRRSY